jgi:hypothetical protein
MRANPGGEIDPKDVVGRDRLIAELWAILDVQSVVIEAERRMGKSSIIKKMRGEPAPGVKLLYRDVEGIQTPLEFVERVYEDMEAHFSALQKGAGNVRRMFQAIGGTEIGGIVRFPESSNKDWKRLLEGAVQDLAGQLGGSTVVLVWDELPLMIQKIAQSSGPGTAMDMLDTLRGLRQAHRKVRMVFTGSIGLHHVIAGLKAAGHMNDATNDMRVVEVPELADADAADLARRLLKGEQLHCEDVAGTVEALVKATNAIPFYIHHVVAGLKSRGAEASPSLVEQNVRDAIVDPTDRWHLQHFRDRLTGYYGAERLPVVLKVLDEVAVANAPVSFGDIERRISGSLRPDASAFTKRIVNGDSEGLRLLLDMLARDHYLRQENEAGRYVFRLSLIRTWWRLRRNLSP